MSLIWGWSQGYTYKNYFIKLKVKNKTFDLIRLKIKMGRGV